MRVTLRLLAMEDMEPEMATFCNQARLPMEGLGHQLSHKTFDLQFVLPVGCTEVKMEQKLRGWPSNGWSILRLMPGEEAHP